MCRRRGPRAVRGLLLAGAVKPVISRLCVLLSLSSLAACVADAADGTDKGDEDAALDTADALGKDDSFQRPTEHGALALGASADARLTSSARFHAWDLELTGTGTAQVVLTTAQTSSGAEVDTVVYLYRWRGDRWGSYIAKNDDAEEGDTLWSQLDEQLTPGRYRVIVKGYRATTYGRFRLALGCAGEACAPAPAACAFGTSWGELDLQRFAFGAEARLTSPAGLSELERAQVVRAMQASTHTDVTTAEEAFARADGGELVRVELRDYPAVRLYTAWHYGAGDNLYGAIFDVDGVEPATEIHDGDFYECLVAPASCVFGTHYDLAAVEGLEVTLEATFDPGSDTTQLIRDQIVAAAQLQLPELTTVGAVFDRVTDHEVRRVDVRHAATGREFSFYTYILGDHRFGAAFDKGTTTIAVRVEDDVFAQCARF